MVWSKVFTEVKVLFSHRNWDRGDTTFLDYCISIASGRGTSRSLRKTALGCKLTGGFLKTCVSRGQGKSLQVSQSKCSKKREVRILESGSLSSI